jgi:hypothetical protein
MSYETIVLLENISTENPSTVSFAYSDKQKGAGYHNLKDNTHTVIYQFDNFKGTVKMQGTLEQFPGEDDWADIIIRVDGEIVGTQVGGDSSTLDNDYTQSFNGNYVWIRAAYNLQDGVITSVRYNL